MHFRSVADLSGTLVQNLHRIPHDVDIVVGIPRSGLVPASLISLFFNLPLADIESFVAGRLLASGRTKKFPGLERKIAEFQHALLVDDSIQSGTAMRAARQVIGAAVPSIKLTTLAVYGADAFGSGADIVLEVVQKPRIFQWNVMHHQILESACVDIDGILCRDPTASANDDGPAYLQFLKTSAPLYRPTRRIHALVTSRLEKYRVETETWLAQFGVRYDRLHMLDVPDARTRRENNMHATFKADVYKSSDAALFIESEPKQAYEIAAFSKKPVLWLPGAEMIYHDGKPPRDPLYTLRRQGTRTAKALFRTLIGNSAYAKLKSLVKSS